MKIRIAMVAGETSGDLLASHLIRALRRHLPDAEFFGIGGPKMQAEGFDVRWPCELLAVHGQANSNKRRKTLAEWGLVYLAMSFRATRYAGARNLRDRYLQTMD